MKPQSHRCYPCALLTLLFTILIILPACSSAQPKPTPSVNISPKAQALVEKALVTSSNEHDEQKKIEETILTRVYDIRHLIAPIPNFTNDLGSLRESTSGLEGGVDGSLFEADEEDSEQLDRSQMVERVMTLTREAIDPDGWRSAGGLKGAMSEQDGILIVTNTAKNHNYLEAYFAELAKYRFHQVAVQLFVYEMPIGHFQTIQKTAGERPILDKTKSDALLEALANDKETKQLKSNRTICFNSQKISLTDLSIATDREEDPIVGKGASEIDILYSTAINKNRAASIVNLHPTIDPHSRHVMITMSAIINRPHKPATADDKHIDDDRVRKSLTRLDSRVIEFRTTVRIPNGGAAILTTSQRKANDAGEPVEVVTILRAATIEESNEK